MSASTIANDSGMAAAMSKVFNDPVHGHIELHPILIKIIDTPEFQRLREIKQLGPVYYVYAGASHNRFEHSIGVCFLAGKLLDNIKRKQPELNITDEDVLCVMIAGLCHDLGHAIMSHLFERFIQEMELECPEDSVNPHGKKTHEQVSVLMFDHLIEKYNLRQHLRECNIEDIDILFIKEQIEGPPYQGRELIGRPDKKFLYEIVANRRNGVDVDKWDYMMRDCMQLGMKCSIDLTRFLQFAKVIQVDNEQQICLRDKQAPDVYIMMQTRKMLHDRAYRHRVANIITSMLIDALKKANGHLKFKGRAIRKNVPKKEYKMTEAYQDMEAFAQLTDHVVFSKILYSEDPNLAESKQLVERVLQRKLYHFINSGIYSGQGTRKYKQHQDAEDEIKTEIIQSCCCNKDNKLVTHDDFVVTLINSDFGMSNADPVQNMRFYSKEDPHKGKRIQKREVSGTIADCFSDQRVEIYSRSDEQEKIHRLEHLFQCWCEKNRFFAKRKQHDHMQEGRGTDVSTDEDNSDLTESKAVMTM